LVGFRLQTRVYRAHNPRWAFAPTSGRGAALYGGRFNPVDMPALYTSMRSETAWLEAQQAFPFKPQPLTLCAYEVDCADVVDLTDAKVRSAFGTSADWLAAPWELELADGATPTTWRLARTLIAAGYAGAVVPSFAPGAAARDINVVFWYWQEARPYRVAVIDDEGRLPAEQRSWS